MKAKAFLLALVLVISTVDGFGVAFGDEGLCRLIPDELLAAARERGCTQVTDFFRSRPGMLNPPYAYGYLAGPSEDSAAFWCQKEEGGLKRFFLMIYVRRGELNKVRKCPNIIEWQNSYPGGLSIYKDNDSTLDEFVYVDEPHKKGPKGVKMTQNGILSEYDGVEVLFYCHNSRWLVRVRH